MTNYQPLGHKRRRLERANIFLDVEALDGEGSEDVTEDENISLQNFIDDPTTNSVGQSDSDESWDGIDEQTRKGSRRIVGNRAQISHPRLAQVIARYEARRIDRQGDEVGQEGGSDDQDEDEDDETHSIIDKQNEEEDHENDFVIDKEVVQVARAVMSIRKDDGIFLWRVRVHEGAEAESYWLMQQRLHVRPLLAKAVLYPSPGTRKYILVQAQRKSAVEELCKHLSTVRHPLDVACIPESEHLEWTNWRHAPHPRVQSPPCWGRLRKAAVLQEHNIAANIRKYAGDLAFVRCARGRQKAEVCVIPRVPFLESTNIPDTDERVRIKTVRRPRLIHPEWIGHRKPDPDNVQSVNTDLFWVPERAYPLQTISPGVCRFVDKRHKDVYRLPFTTAIPERT
ncbi:hypothetical protein APHAL10511_000357 [Amanita phalloides]|nr:hypothetical protein APHAL10511_000357 [Amanita phalloides]